MNSDERQDNRRADQEDPTFRLGNGGGGARVGGNRSEQCGVGIVERTQQRHVVVIDEAVVVEVAQRPRRMRDAGGVGLRLRS